MKINDPAVGDRVFFGFADALTDMSLEHADVSLEHAADSQLFVSRAAFPCDELFLQLRYLDNLIYSAHLRDKTSAPQHE